MVRKEVARSEGGKKDPFLHVDVPIRRDGKEMILPDSPEAMSYRSAIGVLHRKIEEEESEVEINEVVEAFPWDGALALMKAMKQIYGWAQAVPTPGFWGPEPPQFLTLKTGVHPQDRIQVIWGSFSIPSIEGRLECGHTNVNGRLVFRIGGLVKRKHHRAVLELADLTRHLVRTDSMYRGKAFRLHVDNKGQIDFSNQPKFIDTGAVAPEELVFPEIVESQVRTNIFAPIQKTEYCRRHKVPLNRGILLEGPYGVGKTLTATVTAQKCEEHGWTFIMIERVAALQTALEFAQLYAPAVVFAEDIDRVLSGSRDQEMDAILNTVDGVQTKGHEIIIILTTNEVQKINKAMLRPGRLDAVISITPPDADAARRLMRVYSRGLLPKNDPLTRSGEALAGKIPAVIREVVERSKLEAILESNDGVVRLSDDNLFRAAEAMKTHLELLQERKDIPPTPQQQVGMSVDDIVANRLAPTNEVIKELQENVKKIINKFGLR